MLANIVQELIAHINSKHAKHEDKNVDYVLLGNFRVRFDTLKFEGYVLGINSDNEVIRIYDLAGGQQVLSSTISLASRLLTEDATKRGLAEGYYMTDFPDQGSYRKFTIEMQNPGEEFDKEVEAIEDMFGKPREANYPLPNPFIGRILKIENE